MGKSDEREIIKQFTEKGENMKTTDGYEVKINSYYYLATGQEVILNKCATGNDGKPAFLVTPFYEGEAMSVSGAGGEHHEMTAPYEHEGDEILVFAIFKNPQIEKISKEYLMKIEAVKNKNHELLEITKEVHKVERELREAQGLKTDLEKGIISKVELKNAETIAVFATDRVQPYILSEKMKKELKISISISFINGQERAWCYTFDDYDDGWGSSNYIDKEYGFLIDLEENEIEEIAKQRAKEKFEKGDFSEWQMLHTDEKYLADDQIAIKNEAESKRKENRKEELKEAIEKKKAELKKLESSL